MRLRKGEWDGAQPRGHILKVLRDRGVQVEKLEDDLFELIDLDGDPVVLHMPNPVPPEIVVHIYRRFGALHGFLITDLNSRKPH